MGTGLFWLGTEAVLGQHPKPEWAPNFGLGQQAGVWVKLLVEVGFVALAEAVAWNSCAQEGWALQAVLVSGADL